jgi:dihydrofolate reductase
VHSNFSFALGAYADRVAPLVSVNDDDARSRTLREPLPRPNSTLLDGDAVDAVADLKQQPGEDLHVMGSGELIQSLMRRGLIDEFMLMIHPLVLGSGRRLFADDSPTTTLRLVDSKTATTGVLIATYQP